MKLLFKNACEIQLEFLVFASVLLPLSPCCFWEMGVPVQTTSANNIGLPPLYFPLPTPGQIPFFPERAGHQHFSSRPQLLVAEAKS